MGLLDEAIREHLELKRRRGADPSAIAREEREALAEEGHEEAPGGAAIGEGDSEAQAAGALPGSHDEWSSSEPDTEPAPAAAWDQEEVGEPEPAAGDLALAAQETAELDMRTVIGEAGAADGHAPVGPISEPQGSGAGDVGATADDGFGWEMPGEREDGRMRAEIPGQERLTFE